MQTILLIVHILVALGVIVLVLIQQGKGADVGAAFGSGASSTVFGARGSSSFLTRATGVLAALFFMTSLSLAYLGNKSSGKDNVTEGIKLPASTGAPAKPVVPPVTSDVPVPPPAGK